MADIELRNGWNQASVYRNVASVSFATPDGGVATYYENGSGNSDLAVQADWGQIYSGAPDFIKNRPFYIYYTSIVEPELRDVVKNNSKGTLLYSAVIEVPQVIVENNYYIVYWDNTGWRCQAVLNSDGILQLGTPSILEGIAEEGAPPFIGEYSVEDSTITFYTIDSGGYVIGLLDGKEQVKKIDSKFLPEMGGGSNGSGDSGGSGETVVIRGADWNARPGEDGFIENKPTIPDPQIQSDWNQTNSEAVDFIANVPEAFKHTEVAVEDQQIAIDTSKGWIKKSIPSIIMTVIFEDDTIGTYKLVGSEVVEE